MPDWLKAHLPEGWTTTNLVVLSLCLFLITFIGSIVVVGWALIRIPPDYFIGEKPPMAWANHHPFIRWPLRILKNLFGMVLVLLGIAMSLPGVPGQGVLTILLGAMLLDFPGKRSCERWLISRRGILNSLNKIRVRYGRDPIRLEAGPDCKPDA